MLNSQPNYPNGGVSVFQLANSHSRSIPVADDPVVDGQREQLVFPN